GGGEGRGGVGGEGGGGAGDRADGIARGEDRAGTFAPKERGGLQRDRLEPRAAGPRRHGDREAGDERDDHHHRDHLDEREPGVVLGSRHVPARSVMLRSALMIETMSAPMTVLTTMIVTGPTAPISRSRPTRSLCS